jgi:hypothetical protein
MKILGQCVLFLAILFIWLFVLLLASKGFYEMWYPLGNIVNFAYVGLTIVALVQWHKYWSDINSYIIVYLDVTDGQRKALLSKQLPVAMQTPMVACRHMW